jgi:hypothetical protein
MYYFDNCCWQHVEHIKLSPLKEFTERKNVKFPTCCVDAAKEMFEEAAKDAASKHLSSKLD